VHINKNKDLKLHWSHKQDPLTEINRTSKRHSISTLTKPPSELIGKMGDSTRGALARFKCDTIRVEIGGVTPL